ncbi:hypothetical protein JCM19376_30260 [Fusibacter bizertensis]
MIKPSEKQNIGNAGEYYIASYLSAHDLTVTITLGRAEKYDLLCVTPNDSRTIKLSIKTRWENKRSFTLSKKDEEGEQRDFYYVFINLNEFEKTPDFWIIPSKRVNYVLKNMSNIYFNQWTTKSGESPKDMSLRKLDFMTSDKTKSLYPEDWIMELDDYYKDKGLKNMLNAIS